MSTIRDYWYRTTFRLRVHEASGDAFQLLFNKVMHYWDPRFQSIVPWGNWGDGGNDGWIQEDGHYHQLYAPKVLTDKTDTASTALSKAIDDYDKLPKKWAAVQRYTFVMNDRFGGMPAPIEAALQKLKIDKTLIEAGSLSTSQLLTRFMSLPIEVRHDVVGFVPDGEDGIVDNRAMGELLMSLANRGLDELLFLQETAPDFDKKIVFNGITTPIAERIRFNSQRLHLVDAFLDNADIGSRQAIAQELHSLYEASRVAIPATEPESADDRYLWLLLEIIPASAKKHPHSVAAYREAAEMVVAKYFETCDVYEHPNGAPAA
jgi:hypothetical protein